MKVALKEGEEQEMNDRKKQGSKQRSNERIEGRRKKGIIVGRNERRKKKRRIQERGNEGRQDIWKKEEQ